MDAFIFSANAVLPIILMVSIGWFSHKVGLIDDDFIKKGNKFNFRIGFFALIFISMYSIEEINSVHRNLILFSFCSILCVIGLGFLIAAIFVKDPKQKGVMVQAVYRSNFAIIGVPLANMLFGEKGGSCAAIIIAVSIPLYNIFGVLALTIFIKENRAEKKFLENAKEISLKLIKNPMLQGIFFGGICLALRPHLNGWTLKKSSISFIYVALNNISKMASPFALILLGANFKFSAVKNLFWKIFAGTILRLVIVPVLCLSAAHILFPEFAGPEYAALIALFGSPVAVASAIMADQMGNDGELAGQILVWTTLFSTLTLFALIVIFRARGIL